MVAGVAIDAGTFSSSSIALMCCVDQLRSGDNDAMICIAAHQDMSINRFDAMHKLGLLSERTRALHHHLIKRVLVHFLPRVVGFLFFGGCQTLVNSNEPSPGGHSWRRRWYSIQYRGGLQHLPVPEVCKTLEWNQMKSMLLVG